MPPAATTSFGPRFGPSLSTIQPSSGVSQVSSAMKMLKAVSYTHLKVKTASERAKFSRKLVFELLVGDQPDRAHHPDPDSKFWRWADRVGVDRSRFPAHRHQPAADRSHPAMAVRLDACIECNLCVRACREVQVNDVIGMAARNADAKIVFDFDLSLIHI